MSESAANPSLLPQPGTLYVVATPIGNLADLTERARAILAAVDVVACEDTRTTGAMLTRLGLRRELVAYHEHNEDRKSTRLNSSHVKISYAVFCLKKKKKKTKIHT